MEDAHIKVVFYIGIMQREHGNVHVMVLSLIIKEMLLELQLLIN
jgi:hypothetical protein